MADEPVTDAGSGDDKPSMRDAHETDKMPTARSGATDRLAAARDGDTAKMHAARAAGGEKDDPDDAEALRAELAALKKKNAELEAKATATPHPGRGRMAGAMILVIIGCLLATFAVTAVWLDNTVLNTDTWVATVGPLASEPAIQNYVADQATAALFAQVDVKNYVDQVIQTLPPKAQPLVQPLVGPIVDGIKGFVHTQAVNFTHSAQFATAWVKVNQVGHKAIVDLLTGKTTYVQASSSGQVTLDIGLIVDTIKQQLVANGMAFVDKIPTSALNKQIVLFESPLLANIIQWVKYLQASAFILPILAVLFLIAAIAVATDKRKSFVWIGAGIVIVMLVPLEALYLAQYPLVTELAKASVPAEVATILYNTLFAGLRTIQRGFVVMGLVIWIVAMLFGPARWAVALRNGFKNGLGTMSSSWDFGKFGAFVARNKPVLRGLGVAVGAVVLLATAGRTPWVIFWTAVLLVVWLALIEVFGHDTAALASAKDDDSGQASSA